MKKRRIILNSMKRILLFVLSFCFFKSKAQDIDVLHYSFEIFLNDENDSIAGIAEIRVLRQKPFSKIVFDLKSVDQSGKGMQVIKVFKREGVVDLPFSQTSEKLVIELQKNDAPDTVELMIAYRGIPADGLIDRF